MNDFFSHYDGVDRVDLHDGFYVDIKRCLTQAETAQVNFTLVGDHVRREAEKGREVSTMQTDHQAYNLALLAAHIVEWNITRNGAQLPLPPYVAPKKPTAADPANTVRRDSIAQLPAPVAKKILKRISDNEKLFDEDESDDPAATFPGDGESASDAA